MPTPSDLALAKLKSLGTLSDPIPGSSLLTDQDMQGGPGLTPGSSNTPEPEALNFLFDNNLKRETQNRLINEERIGKVGPDGRPMGGPDLSALHTLLGQTNQDIAQSPITAQNQQVDQDENATHAAIQAGFGGSKDIGVADDPRGLVGDAGGRVMGGIDPSGMNPLQKQAKASRDAAMYKESVPIVEQQLKNQGAMDLDKQKTMEDLSRMLGMGQGPNGNPALAPSHTPNSTSTPPNPSAPPMQSPSWFSLLTGIGAPPGTSLLDRGGAESERLKYDKGFATPDAPLYQNTSFGNLEQVRAMFPGIRGIAQLMGKFQEHQANVGHETPAASLQRLDGMRGMIDQTEQSLSDPSLMQYKRGADGHLEPTTTPAAMIQARALMADTRSKFNLARNVLLQQNPGLAEHLQQAVGMPVQNSNSIPGSSIKMVLDANGNLVQKGGQ